MLSLSPSIHHRRAETQDSSQSRTCATSIGQVMQQTDAMGLQLVQHCQLFPKAAFSQAYADKQVVNQYLSE